jgi:4-amino-4-deoxy-L-arabinose transferase-like glycosyltransferase
LRKTATQSKANVSNQSESAAPVSFASSRDIVFFSIIMFAIALRLTALFIPHNEADEVIYLTLAEKVTQNFSDYTLQGTPLLAKLPKATYDQPIFLRPPLFVYLLAFFGIFHAQVFLPLLSALGTLWTTSAIATKLSKQNNQMILSCLVLSFCPILLFSSVRILIDIVLALLVSLCVLITILAIEKAKTPIFAMAGLIFGLALLTKESAVFILPVILYLILRAGINLQSLISIACFAVAALLISTPWFLYFFKVTGSFARGAVIDAEYLQVPFIKMAVERSWYFYFVHVALISPIYLFGYFEIIERLRKRESLMEVIWVLSYFIPLTVHGFMGNSYQTRYILPAIPALALLTAASLNRQKHWAQLTAVVLLAYELLTGILNSVVFKLADVFSPFQFFIELMS